MLQIALILNLADLVQHYKMRKKGQVWVETVIYTLIGLSLIGLVLAILTPKINESKDRALIDKTIESLNLLDTKINEVLQAPGNKRKVELEIKKGDFFIDTTNNKLGFIIENSKSKYSEPGETINVGRISLVTTELSKNYQVALEISYNHDITFDDVDSVDAKKFSAASVPYSIFIENKGFDLGVLQIDLTN